MRIRTVKPAFWANEKMACLPDFTRLLAIGLLNYADDRGFFWANSKMIRGSLFPFEEDHQRIVLGLAQLEAEGYLKLGKSTDGRDAGCIVNFSKHQRVDKPQTSEIEAITLFQERSKNDTGTISDQSALYRKGMEGNGKDSSCPEPALPDSDEKKVSPKPEIHPNTEAEKFVDWFMNLLSETGAPVRPLTKPNRYAWADAYDKMIRLDARTKDQVKEVCRWARNEKFWSLNFMSPMKLRDKKDGVMFFDQFLNKMGGSTRSAAVEDHSINPLYRR